MTCGQRGRRQRGVTLFGLLFWAILIGVLALVAMRVLPTMNEYFTILRAVNKVAKEGGTTVPEIRAAFEKQKEIEYSISSIGGKDLSITKENEKIVGGTYQAIRELKDGARVKNSVVDDKKKGEAKKS